MKNKLMKLMGVVLTLAMLAGLIVMALPVSVSAANLAWTGVTTPNSPLLPNFLLTTSGEWIYALAPNGTTMLAYNNANQTLYKSTDGGLTFTAGVDNTTAPGIGLNGVTGITQMVFASDSSTVIATSGTALYGSTDAGDDWSTITSPLTSGSSITAIAVAPGPSILVGGTGGQAYVYGSTGAFGGGWTSIKGLDPSAKVDAIAFSPNHATDNLVFMVTDNGTGTYFQTAYGPRNVGVDYANRTISNYGGVTNATIAFPSDFNASSNPNVLVSISSNTPTPNDPNGVYMVGLLPYNGYNTPLSGSATLSTDNITDMAFNGTWSAGTVYVIGSSGLSYLTGITVVNASGNWAYSVKPATGTISQVETSPANTNVYVMGDGANGGLSVSTDGGATFNQINLINVASGFGLGNTTFVDANTMFVTAKDNSGYSIFKTTNAGVNWQRVAYSDVNSYKQVYASPSYATDKTIYVTPAANSTIWKSIDGGNTYLPVITNATNVGAFALVDANTFFYSDSGAGLTGTPNIYKSSAFTPAALPSGLVYSLDYVSPTNLLVGTTTGGVYQSTDGGATFTALASPFTGGNVVLAANATSTYAASGAAVDVLTPSGWAPYDSATSATLPVVAPSANITQLALGANGTLYAVNSNAGDATILRNADGVDWQSMTSTANAPSWNTLGMGNATNITVVNTGTAAAPANTIYATSLNGIANFTDTISAAPTFISPATGAQLDSTTASISWNPVAGATEYEWTLSTTSDMVSGFVASGKPSATQVFLPNAAGTKLINGQTYYVTVQVIAPFFSQVSPVASFQTKLTTGGSNLGAVGNVAPAAGSTITATSPTFQWAAVVNATSYDFKLSSKPDFSDTIDSETGLTDTVFTTTVTLQPGTYYWEVRAVNGTNTSDWLQSSFTVAAPATTVAQAYPTPTIVVNVPTPTQPINVSVPTPSVIVSTTAATPAWVWVIIAIGAVLVIAVIVLIARTRRV